jgi:hypothetical protein
MRQLIARTPGVRPRTSVWARKTTFLRRTVFARPLLLVAALAAPSLIRVNPPQTQDFTLACLILWGFGLIAAQAHHRLFEHPDHFVFPLLPISNADILRQQVRALLFSIIPLAVAVFLGFGLIPALIFDELPWRMTSVRSAVLTVLLVPMAVSYAIASLRWNWPGWIARSIPAGVFGISIAYRISADFKAWLTDLLESHGDTLAACLPSGWAVLPWAAWQGSAPPITALALLPVIPMIGWIPSGWHWIQENYRIRETVLLHFLTEVPEDADPEFADAVVQAITQSPSRGRTAITDAIRERGFLMPIQQPGNRIQRLIWKWWTPRQRVAAEFLAGTRGWPANWGQSIRRGLIAIAATWITEVVTLRFFPEFKWLVIVPIAWAGIALFPGHSVYQLRWFPLGSGGGGVSLIHLYPITFLDVVRIRWKVVIVRSIVSVPIAALATAIGMHLWGESAPLGAVIGAQIFLAPAFLSPVGTAYRLDTLLSAAAGTRRSWSFQMLRLVTAVLLLLNVGAFLLLILPFVGLGVGAVMALLNYGFVLALARFMDRVRLDAFTQAPTG